MVRESEAATRLRSGSPQAKMEELGMNAVNSSRLSWQTAPKLQQIWENQQKQNPVIATAVSLCEQAWRTHAWCLVHLVPGIRDGRLLLKPSCQPQLCKEEAAWHTNDHSPQATATFIAGCKICPALRFGNHNNCLPQHFGKHGPLSVWRPALEASLGSPKASGRYSGLCRSTKSGLVPRRSCSFFKIALQNVPNSQPYAGHKSMLMQEKASA